MSHYALFDQHGDFCGRGLGGEITTVPMIVDGTLQSRNFVSDTCNPITSVCWAAKANVALGCVVHAAGRLADALDSGGAFTAGLGGHLISW
jgi:hypothetical protein